MTVSPRTSLTLTLGTLRRFSAPFVVFAVLFAGKSAFASCGDYLLHRDMAVDSIRAPVSATEFAPESMPDKPCSGPHCRQAPSPTTIPAQPFEWTAPGDPAVVSVPAARDRSRSFRRLCDGDPRKRSGYPDDIERPPRLG
jgi:hypothetical protein